jgi:hypothetical protein
MKIEAFLAALRFGCFAVLALASVPGFAQSSGATFINNEQWIDGIALTGPQQVYAASGYNWGNNGGIIHWINTRGTSVLINGNAFGNTATLPAPQINFGGSCTIGVPNSTYINVQILPFDSLGNLGTPSVAATVETSTSGTQCLLVTPPAAITNFAGLSSFEVQACTSNSMGVCSTAYTIQAKHQVSLTIPAVYGPFNPTISQIPFDWSVGNGPTPPPVNSAGLVVQNTVIDFGTGPYLISIPQVPGIASGVAGYKRNVSTIQLSPSFPNGIPELPEPWGQLCSLTTCPAGPQTGTPGKSVTADDVLYDSATCGTLPCTPAAVQVSEPHTFPVFQAGYLSLQINNPGVPLATGVWAANTYYWVGERLVVNASSTQEMVIGIASGDAGTSGSALPAWSSVCMSSIGVNQTCSDGTAKWTILYVANTWSSSHGAYSQGDEIYDGVGTLWEAQCTSTGGAGSVSFTPSGVGFVVASTSGATCPSTLAQQTWINIGLNTLVSPQFAFFSNSCATSSGAYLKQCAGDGTTSNPYLTPLQQWAAPSANWSGCTVTATCAQPGNSPLILPYTLLPQYSYVTGLGSGAFPSGPSVTAGSCAPWWPGCSPLPNVPYFVQAVWFTPSGGASPTAEAYISTTCGTGCKTLVIAPPSNPPPNAVGWMPFVSTTSANDVQAKPNGVQGYCVLMTNPGYVANLPYGALCAPTASFVLTSLSVASTAALPQRPTAVDASEIAVGLAGLPITGPWPGGAYGVTINDISIECSKQNMPTVIEPYSWGVFNMSAQEGSNQNGVAHGMLQTRDCAGGGYYLFSPAAEDAGAGAFHVNTGQVADYTYGVRVEDVNAFRALMDVSIGPAMNSQYATRAGVQFKVNLVSSIPEDGSVVGIPLCGEMVDMHGEDTIEQMDVSNCAIHAANIYGRAGNSGRSSVYGLHIEPFTADYNANQIVALGQMCNIQDDTINPITCLSTEKLTDTTSGFFAAGDVAGSSSAYETLLTTDPNIPSQFYDGIKWGTMAAYSLGQSGNATVSSVQVLGATTGSVSLISPTSVSTPYSIELPSSQSAVAAPILVGAASSNVNAAAFGTLSNASNTELATFSGSAPLSTIDMASLSTAGDLEDSTIPVTSVVTLSGTQTLTNKNLTSSTNTFPTLNQNTTGSAGSVPWSGITAPTTLLSISLPPADTTSFTWTPASNPTTTDWTWTAAADTGTSTVPIFEFTDGLSNSRSGPLVSINTANGSNALPILLAAQGTSAGVEMTSAGLLTVIPSGTGGINATELNGNTYPSSFTAGGLLCATATNVMGSITVPVTEVPYGAASGSCPTASGHFTFSNSTTTLTIGGGTTAGTLALNSSSGSGGVDLVSASASGTYTATFPAVTGTVGLGLSVPTGTATFTPGTGVSSVACASGYSCNNTRGTLKIVGSSAGVGTIATVTFSATLPAAPTCFASINGGGTFYGIGNSAPSTSSFVITDGVGIGGNTVNVNYWCQP